MVWIKCSTVTLETRVWISLWSPAAAQHFQFSWVQMPEGSSWMQSQPYSYTLPYSLCCRRWKALTSLQKGVSIRLQFGKKHCCITVARPMALFVFACCEAHVFSPWKLAWGDQAASHDLPGGSHFGGLVRCNSQSILGKKKKRQKLKEVFPLVFFFVCFVVRKYFSLYLWVNLLSNMLFAICIVRHMT